MDELDGVEVIDNPERRRFEARLGRKVLGWASYDQTSEIIVFTHTEVSRRWERLGLGSRLVQATLDHVRSQGMQVLSTCPFVSDWINRHPDYDDLVYRPGPGTSY
ncbi:N-acetyltransferase [Propioniciclava coleopterorum]|uniref:N-acetyltransferase n=1 Tax=Propioniciclava coleopterorum TaxID=2714937 RepID=A0A6G7Y750_9ACTN|nr:GNAT family N-acetyltransferase [Propioniciclava coleopterorum]QIK72506.1 N-acetyltransferase [Propioniciclava coleopterorum]